MLKQDYVTSDSRESYKMKRNINDHYPTTALYAQGLLVQQKLVSLNFSVTLFFFQQQLV